MLGFNAVPRGAKGETVSAGIAKPAVYSMHSMGWKDLYPATHGQIPTFFLEEQVNCIVIRNVLALYE